MSDEPIVESTKVVESTEDDLQPMELLLQTYSTELNRRIDQFEVRQLQLDAMLADNLERTRRSCHIIEQLLSRTETQSMLDPYAYQYDSANPNSYDGTNMGSAGVEFVYDQNRFCPSCI